MAISFAASLAKLTVPRNQQELGEKRIAHHLVPFLCRSNGGMLSVFHANELSVGYRDMTSICRHRWTSCSSRCHAADPSALFRSTAA